MRQFIRHPFSIPIEACQIGQQTSGQILPAFSIGMGGLAFRHNTGLELGSVVRLRISYVDPEFESDARVVWRKDNGTESEMGVEFINPDDAYKARMVEQVCHIEDYRQKVLSKEGRNLTSEEAAVEWINNFAADFPNPGSEAIN